MLQPEPYEVWELFGDGFTNKIWCGYCYATEAPYTVVFLERSKLGSEYLNHLARCIRHPQNDGAVSVKRSRRFVKFKED